MGSSMVYGKAGLLWLLTLTTPLFASSASKKVTWIQSTDGFDRQSQTSAEASNETFKFQFLCNQNSVNTLTQVLTYKPTTLTETKALFSVDKDQETFSGGISQWVHNQVQVGIDVSQTDRDPKSVLNSSFDTIETYSKRRGIFVFAKHLVNPITISTYSLLVSRDDNDFRYFGSGSLKHFFKGPNMAIEGFLGAGTGLNLHSYESSLWAGKMIGEAELSVEYRAYLEKSEFTYGSDAVEIGAKYTFEHCAVGFSAGQYLSNRNYKANFYSLEISKEF